MNKINKLKLSKIVGIKQNKLSIIEVTKTHIIYCVNQNTKFEKIPIEDYN